MTSQGGPSSLRFRGRFPPMTSSKKKFDPHHQGLVSKRPTKDAWNVVGYATAESYDLVTLERQLISQGVYQVFGIHEELRQTCICARAKIDVEGEDGEGAGSSQNLDSRQYSSELSMDECGISSASSGHRGGGGGHHNPREIFFFSDGSVIFWSVPELEREMVLRFLRNGGDVDTKTTQIEVGHYDQDTVFEESELMTFSTKVKNGGGGSTHLDQKGTINLRLSEDMTRDYMEKFAFSNAMAASVKLGALESGLDRIIDSIEFLSEDMKAGRPIVMSRREVLRKTGELFALRHVLNLSSDLLDTPDFYWDRENLESLYMSTCAHLAIAKRIRITNEKIQHCAELLDLVTNHLNDNHHVRLEWFIIILIMIEVGFEVMHLAERFL